MFSVRVDMVFIPMFVLLFSEIRFTILAIEVETSHYRIRRSS